MLQAQYFQGSGSAVALAYGPVNVGDRFTGRSVSQWRGTPPFPEVGSVYTITALLADLTGNIGDQATLSGPDGTFTVSTDWFQAAVRLQ